MYKKEFDTLLNRKIPLATLLYGECNFFIQYYGKKIKALLKHKCDIETHSFYFDEYDSGAINEILTQQSLFASTSLVILRIDSLKLSPKRTKAADIKDFLANLNANANCYLVIEFYDNGGQNYSKETKTLSNLFQTNEYVNVRFFNPNQKEAMEILQAYAKKLSLHISPTNLLYLYETQNNEIEFCVNELQKFTIFESEITKADIDRLSYGLFTHTIDELCDTIILRGDYLKIVAKIDEQGISDMDIIETMQRYFYRLFLFFSTIKSNGTYNSKEILGHALPKHIEEKYARLATRLKESQYLRIFRLLNDWRCQNISGKSRNYFSHLINLQEIIK